MPGWAWLTDFTYTRGFLFRVLIKAVVLFIAVNVLFALVNPIPLLGKMSVYNVLVRGRERLPYGEHPAAYNLSLYSIDAMFASHVVSTPKPSGEYRVFLIGDSSTWGILLDNDETLAGMLNAANLQFDGRNARFYNLGYPILSATKDLLLLDYALRYHPDMVIWLISLDSLPMSDQLRPPLLQNNAANVRDLIARYGLPIDPNDPALVDPTFIDQTLVGQRRALADWLRLQLFGFAWQNTAIDQVYPDFNRPTNDFEAGDLAWSTFSEPAALTHDVLAFAMIDAGRAALDDIPLLIVNEPIYIADGANSDARYNLWYPRWAYDQYRQLLADHANTRDYAFLDVWDFIEPERFTDSPVHYDAVGTRRLSEQLAVVLSEIASR